MTVIQASLRCKCAIMSCGSLNADLTIDENLTLNPPITILQNFAKIFLICLQLDSHPMVHMARLHAYI
jgi:hypothetical protein